jgi:hypothetical protein
LLLFVRKGCGEWERDVFVGETSPFHLSSVSVPPGTCPPKSPESQDETEKRAEHREAGDKKHEQDARWRPINDSKVIYEKSRNEESDDATGHACCQPYRCRRAHIPHELHHSWRNIPISLIDL